ncbi:MAG TPA: NAD-dependent epimerase/dehydratase family protein [Pseudonocardiaceae bacterium]|nr:NAD-dependent epimerase/dehydratase family protein [Pseudonocardiaceae bacterium]
MTTVFVTGASGYIGSGVVRAATRRGMRVLGLARSSTATSYLEGLGVEPVTGDLDDVDALRRGARHADAIVHAAFDRKAYERFDGAILSDEMATARLVEVADSCGVPLVYTSGIGVAGDTGDVVLDEVTVPMTPPAMMWRRDLERSVLARSGVVVRPAFVYGRAGSDILGALITSALDNHCLVYADDGRNVWPNVHVDDLGEIYVLAIERGLRAEVLHGVGGEATPRSVCEAIGRLVGVPVSTLPLEQARRVVPYADWIAGSSIRVATSRTRQLLDWVPAGPDIHEDIEFGSYRTIIELHRGRGE